ncbi:MAG: TRAP transporter TatT component family protein [Spirochaetota bacterium]|nr:TRAP transporter TatT component family protein [Spirochaetota bacterium]
MKIIFFKIIILFFTCSAIGCVDSDITKSPSKKTIKTITLSYAFAKNLIKKGDKYFSDPITIDRVKKALKLYERVSNSNIMLLESFWKASMACAFLSEHNRKEKLKSYYAKNGAEYAKIGINIDDNSAECHYFYAINLGLYADIHRFEALKLLSVMEKEALKAIKLKPKLDYAGGYRFLGRLYFDAPEFLIGDVKKGLSFLKKACELSPEYPPNLLDYSKALIEVNKKEIARKYLTKILLIKKLKRENNFLSLWKKKAKKLLSKL